MNQVTQHVPRYIDQRGLSRRSAEFTTADELMNVDFVKRWKDKPKFSHFGIGGNYLMAVFDDGYSWFVVGKLKTTDGVNLPMWKEKYKLP